MRCWAFIAPLLVMFPSFVLASVGTITEVSGHPSSIIRGTGTLEGKPNAAINTMDVVTTGQGTARIRFVDDTRISVTEQSRLTIDEYVYDPRRGDSSRIGMRVALGTVRYASGQIARVNQQAVDIRTPTATIGVRGTDFFMTVSEAGESFVALVPSCSRDGNCRTGIIDVQTAGGTVTLTEAFTATLVYSPVASPSPPVRIPPSEAGINNMMIVIPPPGLSRSTASNQGSGDSPESTGANADQQRERQTPAVPARSVSDNAPVGPIIITNESHGMMARRETTGQGVAQVVFRDGSTGSVTISHNGDGASTQVGQGGSNTITIRQGR